MTYLSSPVQLLREVFRGSKREGSFSQNFLTVLSGTGINILIQIFISPLLTRIYGPEAYGTYALYNSFCTNIAMVATLRFHQAFLLPQRERDFHALMRLSVASTLLITALIVVIFLLTGDGFLKTLEAEKITAFKYLVPLGIFLIAMNQIFGQWQYRMNAFRKSVGIDTSLLVGVRIFNLAFGWSTNGMLYGLVFGDILGKLAGLMLSIRLIIRDQFKFFFMRLGYKHLKSVFLAYKAYPLLNLPGMWLSLTSEQLPFFLLTAKFGLSGIGLLTLAIGMLDLPKRLFAYSVSSVFYKKAVDLHVAAPERLQEAIAKMFYGLMVISVVPYALVVIFGPELFAFAFGSEWTFSGRLAQYLALYFVLEVITISFGSLFNILRKEKELFYFQVSAFAGRLLVLLFVAYSFDSLEECVAGLVIFNLVFYTVQLFYLFRKLKVPAYKYLAQLFGCFGIVVLIFYGMKAMWNYLAAGMTMASVQ